MPSRELMASVSVDEHARTHTRTARALRGTVKEADSGPLLVRVVIASSLLKSGVQGNDAAGVSSSLDRPDERE